MPRAAIATADVPTKRKYVRRQPAPTIVPPTRHETHSSDFQIGEPKPITDKTHPEDIGRASFDRRLFGSRLGQKGDLILLDKIEVTPEYLAELAFYEEPVTILINQSTHKNAASIFENWSNGQGAEMMVNGKWLMVRDLPVGKQITVKRKIVEQIIRSRIMQVQTMYESTNVENPRNALNYTTTPVHSFAILRDDSPRGADWLDMAYSRPL